MENNNKKRTVVPTNLQFTKWHVTCTECDQQADIQILAYPALLGKHFYLYGTEDEYEMLNADFWLCPRCENEKNTEQSKEKLESLRKRLKRLLCLGWINHGNWGEVARLKKKIKETNDKKR